MSMPSPLTPPDCDLRGLEYMPLLGQHLFGSEFNARVSDSEWRAAITLWWAAWTQMPAASLPDDDAALCRFADLGRDMKTWKRIRENALYGFVKCSDGRLYHPTLAKQALLAWDKRIKDRQRKAEWRAKKNGRDAAVPRDTAGTGVGTGQGQDAAVPADENRRDGTGRDVRKKEEEEAAPELGTAAPAKKNGAAANYAFAGRIIKLSQSDFELWRSTYHAIPDITAELASLDAWYSSPDLDEAKRKKWFQGVSGALNRKHQEFLAKAKGEQSSKMEFTSPC